MDGMIIESVVCDDCSQHVPIDDRYSLPRICPSCGGRMPGLTELFASVVAQTHAVSTINALALVRKPI